jgi:ABC-type glycerol-3-phosphate transport system substrate-binding protein
LDKNIVENMILNLNQSSKIYSDVSYVEKDKQTYSMEILEALASGNSPDLILVSNETLYENLNKIYPIPYTSFPQRDFINSYVDAFSIFMNSEGILSIPLIIDPMVMYYNQGIFKSAGVPIPPKK